MSNIITITDLSKPIAESGVEPQTATMLQQSFLPFFQKAEEWRAKAETLVVTSVDQKHEMQMARTARLALREIRLEADKTRKALKEDSLRYGKAVQGVYNVIEYLITPIEQHLENQEKFAEIQAANERATRKREREAEIAPFAQFVPTGLDFGAMTAEDFEKVLSGARLSLEAKLEAEQRAEAERIERELAEAAERERIRLENEKLKAEAAEREAELKREREAAEAAKKEAEAVLAAERAERERLEREARQKAEAEAAAQRAEAAQIAREQAQREAAEAAAKAAPDMEKLAAFAAQIETLMLAAPTVTGKDQRLALGDALNFMQQALDCLTT